MKVALPGDGPWTVPRQPHSTSTRHRDFLFEAMVDEIELERVQIVFDRFHRVACDLLSRDPEVQRLRRRHGDGFDAHVSNEVLKRGQTVCRTLCEGLLYAYRYGPYLCVDFGAGPSTGLLSLLGRARSTVRYIALESADGMVAASERAIKVVGERSEKASHHRFAASGFMADARDGAQRCDEIVLLFSYFFAQDLTEGFVRALARTVRGMAEWGKPVTIVYTNPVGPSASWMPRGDIHHWYRLFCRELGHRPAIRERTYSYDALANLSERVRRSGSCAAELWRMGCSTSG